MEDGSDPKAAAAAAARKRARSNRTYWTWGCLLLVGAALLMSVFALVYALDRNWDHTDSSIISRRPGVDVEVREGSNLLLHNHIIDGLYTLYEMIELDPAFGPVGPDLLFGAANATYTRLQAQFAVGIRVWDREFFSGGAIFDSDGLFGEEGLVVVIGSFATWIHGAIIGNGPLLFISDESAKENIKSVNPLTALHSVAGLKPHTFDWKGPGAQKRQQIGLVAQEVKSVMPLAVHDSNTYLPDDTEQKSQMLVDYNAIVVGLVGSVKQLWANGVHLAFANGPTACTSGTAYARAECICAECEAFGRCTEKVLNACGSA